MLYIKRVCLALIFVAIARPAVAVLQARKATVNPAALSCDGAPTEPCDSGMVARDIPGGDRQVTLCGIQGDRSSNLRPVRFVLVEAASRNSGNASPEVLSPNSCYRGEFGVPSTYISSVALSSNGEQIIVADALLRRFEFFSLRGGFLSAVSSVKGSPEIPIQPYLIQSSPRGYMVQDSSGRFFALAPNFHVVSSLDFLGFGSKSVGQLKSVYSFTPISNGLLVVADLQKANDKWSTSFVKLSPGSPAEVEPVFEMSIDDPMRDFYHIGLPYLATVDGVGFVLLMKNVPQVLRVDKKKGVLEAFSGPARPVLPAPKGAGTYVGLYNAIEKASMPVGLYSWNRFLFVLSRRPSEKEGETVWTLVKIDPRKDKLVGKPMVLPSHAPHLMIVPGSRHWVVIEKGHYMGVGQQAVTGITLLPSQWFGAGVFPEGYSCQ